MDYRILRQVALGGFSEIFEVEDAASALTERLILKRLNDDMSRRPAVRAAFAEEAKILRELKHPNVVTFRRCYFDDRQRICLVMEQVKGEPLDVWAKRHESRPALTFDLFERTLGAVDYLHHRSSPFLHLDLKPDNVLVVETPDGPQPVLIDFGIARRSGGTGLKAYTPPYGAPEQESGGRLDTSTDVYALGQMLLELIGHSATDGEAAGRLVEVAAKATQKARNVRFANAGEMRVAFRRARTGPLGSSESRPIGTFGWPSREVLRWMVPSVAGVALLVSVFFFFNLDRRGPEPQPNEADLSSEANAESIVPGKGTNDPKQRFAELCFEFEEALIQDRADARLRLRKTIEFLDTVPQGHEDRAWMQDETLAMQGHLDQVELGGPSSEAVRTFLAEQHRNHPREPAATSAPLTEPQ